VEIAPGRAHDDNPPDIPSLRHIEPEHPVPKMGTSHSEKYRPAVTRIIKHPPGFLCPFAASSVVRRIAARIRALIERPPPRSNPEFRTASPARGCAENGGIPAQ
tara:strand:- start:873 stop:1184 length:312 start_codon:yes stop_codon:yes gene_type:complete